jgi:hypothetical protein
MESTPAHIGQSEWIDGRAKAPPHAVRAGRPDRRAPSECGPRPQAARGEASVHIHPWRNGGTPTGPAVVQARASTGFSATPVWLRGSSTSASGVHCATTVPPFTPPSGPRSMTQSASAITSRSCSMTTTL